MQPQPIVNDDLKVDLNARKSLEDALKQHTQLTGDKPEDVIILQVTDREQLFQKASNLDGCSDHERSRSHEGTKSQSKAKLTTIVHQKSHSQSRMSNKSRIDTAENGFSDLQQFHPIVQAV